MTLIVVGYSVIMNITMCKISELHEIIWIFREKTVSRPMT